jgi:hypothetical protein
MSSRSVVFDEILKERKTERKKEKKKKEIIEYVCSVASVRRRL